ncbi:MAG: hypothetical protein ACTJGL_16375, partial [Vreelandella alkaliphila]
MTTDTQTSHADAQNTYPLTVLDEEIRHVMLRDAQQLARRVAGLKRRQRDRKPIDHGVQQVQR